MELPAFLRLDAEKRRRLRKSLAVGIWAGGFLGLTFLAYDASRWAQLLPGYVGSTVILGLATALLTGALGYLFFAGILLKDE